MRSSWVVETFVVWLIGVLFPSCGSAEVNETCSGSGDYNSTMCDEQFDIWPGLYGVIAASFIIVVVVTTLVCTTIVMVHCLKILPSKAQTYTLRDVLPESDEAQKDVEPLVGSGAKRNNTHTVGVNSPELGDERGSISPEGEYLVHPS